MQKESSQDGEHPQTTSFHFLFPKPANNRKAEYPNTRHVSRYFEESPINFAECIGWDWIENYRLYT